MPEIFHILCQVFNGFAVFDFVGKICHIAVFVFCEISAVFCTEIRKHGYAVGVPVVIVSLYVEVNGILQSVFRNIKFNIFYVVFLHVLSARKHDSRQCRKHYTKKHTEQFFHINHR